MRPRAGMTGAGASGNDRELDSDGDNRAVLLERFLRCALDQSPADVLDVGCGDGLLLRRLAEAGVPASGVEAHPGRAGELRREGLEVQQASADALPFRDGQFDWVTIRHVLHHLGDPPAALAEAIRVAHTGLVVAEPWTELALPSQRAMAEVDLWLRARDRERGMLHGPNLTPAEILAALPPHARTTVELLVPLLPMGPDRLRREMEAAAAGLELTPQVEAERERLLQLAAAHRITQPGTVILVCRKA